MLKKRMILCLLMRNSGVFVNSRNFSLQSVGELAWIKRYLDFNAIDELVLLNVDRGEKDVRGFAKQMQELSRFCFVPITAGGGVRTLEHFEILLNLGADKVAVNTVFYDNPGFISEAAKVYGSQCVVASVDYRRQPSGVGITYAANGERNTGHDVVAWAKEVERRGAGEIFLTSIDRDGTGHGYDIEILRAVSSAVSIPVIASGGVGEFEHLAQGIRDGGANAVSAANIFHYIGNGLVKAKMYIRGQGLDFPTWNFSAVG